MSTLDDRPPPPQHQPPPMPPAPAPPPPGRPAIPPTTGRRGGRRGTPVASSPQGMPARRRWGRFAAGATLALLGAWVFAALYVSAGQRVEVLVASDDIEQFHKLDADDFHTVRVASDATVKTISAGDADEIEGRVTAVPILKGTLLSKAQLVPKDQALIRPDEEVLSLELPQGNVPDIEMLGGTLTNVIIKPAQQSGESRKIPGCWILKAGEPDENTRKVQVQVVVPDSDAEDIGAAYLDNRVLLSAEGGGG